MPVRWIPGGNIFANSYLSGGILVDAGVLPMAVDRYRDEIRYIVLTHCHFDHTAHLREIADMTGAEICIHNLDAPGLLEDMQSLAIQFGSRSPGLPPDRLLSDGDRIGSLEVLHTPGHTPGSICLYRSEERALFSGDTVFTDGGFGRFDFPGGDPTALGRSLARLGTLPVKGLFPGHGSPAEEGGRRHIAAAAALFRGEYG
jgi:hydroxyacylglutathione hydrolase